MSREIKAKAKPYRTISIPTYYYCYWKYRTDPVYGVINRYVPEKGKCLVLGCGIGLEINYLNRPGRVVRGIDHDQKRIDIARRVLGYGNSLSFETGDAVTYRPEETFDAVTMIDLLHYFPPQVQNHMLENALQLLNPGGVLLIRDGERKAGVRYFITWFCERVSISTGFTIAGGLSFPSFVMLKDFFIARGCRCEILPAWGNTVFSNKLLAVWKPLLQ